MRNGLKPAAVLTSVAREGEESANRDEEVGGRSERGDARSRHRSLSWPTVVVVQSTCGKRRFLVVRYVNDLMMRIVRKQSLRGRSVLVRAS